MNTPVREGETIEGSRTMRNRPYPVLKCSCRGALQREISTTNSTAKSRSTSLYNYIGLTSSRAGCRALQLYSAPERSISLHLSALFTLILYTLPEGKILFPRDDSGQFLEVRGLGRSRHEGSRTTRNRPYPVLKCSRSRRTRRAQPVGGPRLPPCRRVQPVLYERGIPGTLSCG